MRMIKSFFVFMALSSGAFAAEDGQIGTLAGLDSIIAKLDARIFLKSQANPWISVCFDGDGSLLDQLRVNAGNQRTFGKPNPFNTALWTSLTRCLAERVGAEICNLRRSDILQQQIVVPVYHLCANDKRDAEQIWLSLNTFETSAEAEAAFKSAISASPATGPNLVAEAIYLAMNNPYFLLNR